MQKDAFLEALQERMLCEVTQWTNDKDWNHAKVLDIGSRYGHRTETLAHMLLPLGVECIKGVDTDLHGIDYSTKIFSEEKLDFAYIADFEDRFPIKYSCMFNWLIHANHTLFHLNNQEAALRNLLWCVKPGNGKMLFAIPCEISSDIIHGYNKVILGKNWRIMINQWTQEAFDVNSKNWYGQERADRIYATYLEKVGFRILRTKVLPFTYKFKGDKDYRASVEAYFHEPIMAVSSDKRESLVKDLMKACSSKLKKNTWNFKYILILASRPCLDCNICFHPNVPLTEPPTEEEEAQQALEAQRIANNLPCDNVDIHTNCKEDAKEVGQDEEMKAQSDEVKQNGDPKENEKTGEDGDVQEVPYMRLDDAEANGEAEREGDFNYDDVEEEEKLDLRERMGDEENEEERAEEENAYEAEKAERQKQQDEEEEMIYIF